MMRDPITDAAQDPSCLLCLTPDRDGSWWSRLRPDGPWPSDVPRNFMEEPMTWYDLGLASSTIGMDDWEIGGELYANSLTTGKSIIYRSSDPRFGLYVTSSSQIIFVNYSVTGGSERIYYYDNPPTGEWLSFKMQRAGGWLRWLINDIEVNSVEKTGLYVEMNNASPFFVNEDCNLRNCYFKNLTTGRTVWSYPSEAERVRLITKTNVRTDRGAFEAANPAMEWAIKTALPAGITGTVLARINGECIVNPAQWNRTTATFTGAATDTLEFLTVFSGTLAYGQIAYICGVKRWVIPVSAGNINIATSGFHGLQWTFPDGSTSTAASINRTVTAGTVVCKYVGLLNGKLTINNSTALASSAMRAIDLPRVTNHLYLASIPGLTGSTADLPRVTDHLYLHSLSGLTGSTADLPRVTNYLSLNYLAGLTGSTADLPRVTNYLSLNHLAELTGSIADLPRVTNYLDLNTLPGLTGSTADLPRVTNTLILNTLPGLTGSTADLPRVTNYLSLNHLAELTGSTADLPRVTNTLILNNLAGLTGSTADLPSNTGVRRVYLTPYVTGALSVVATNTPIYYYATGATALEYDETVHNCVAAGGTGKELRIGTGTSAGDADIQTLRDRGWSVTIH